jgi:hypothetical protein
MSNSILSDAVDYSSKVMLIRGYASYYTDKDLAKIFNVDTLAEILENNTYEDIKVKLSNTLSNIKDGVFDIGDVVTINKPFKIDGTYKTIKGVIIGKHIRYKSENMRDYYTEFDIIVQSKSYNDGYSYEIYRETEEYLRLESKDIVNKTYLQDTLKRISRIDIVVNV